MSLEIQVIIPLILCILALVIYPLVIWLKLNSQANFHFVYSEILNAYLGIFVSGFLWIKLEENAYSTIWILFIIIMVYIIISLLLANKRAKKQENYEALYNREKARVNLYLSFVGIHLRGHLSSIFELVYGSPQDADDQWDWGYKRVSVYYFRKNTSRTEIMNLSRICSFGGHETPSDPVVSENPDSYVYSLMSNREDARGKILKLGDSWSSLNRGRAQKCIKYIAAFIYQITNGLDPSSALILFEFQKTPENLEKKHGKMMQTWFSETSPHPNVKSLLDSLKNIPGEIRNSEEYLQMQTFKGKSPKIDMRTYEKGKTLK